jgi:pyridinium-3,5-biscarboxylic acid mononucleotide synthase
MSAGALAHSRISTECRQRSCRERLLRRIDAICATDYDDGMARDGMRQLGERLLAGDLSLDDFVGQVGRSMFADLHEAKLDIDRPRRCGFPEVIFGAGKTVAVLEKLIAALLEHGGKVLATRVSPEQAAELLPTFPTAQYNAVGRTLRIDSQESPTSQPQGQLEAHRGKVVIVTAGTSDQPVAEEALETALWTGAEARLIADVGVAGLHRLTANLSLLEDADAVVVIAGMEGALPSVVGGYVACPVIAVPTSVGYGASFGGIAALLGMLNSCASNVTVVNIDAGFKGGYVAGLIAKNVARRRVDRG